MSSSSSNGAERDLGDDVDKDKQTKPNPKPMPFRRCSTGSRCRIHSNRQSSLHWHQLAVAEQQDIQNIRSCNILYIQYVGRNYRVQSSVLKKVAAFALLNIHSWPRLAPSSSSAAMLVPALQQQPHCNRSHSIPV